MVLAGAAAGKSLQRFCVARVLLVLDRSIGSLAPFQRMFYFLPVFKLLLVLTISLLLSSVFEALIYRGGIVQDNIGPAGFRVWLQHE